MRTRTLVAVVVASLVALGTAGATPVAAASESWSWPASGTLDVYGHGFGHGHGMSQWGAYGAATKALSSAQILAHYYPGTSQQTRTDPALRVWVKADADNDTRVAPITGLSAQTADGSAVLPTTLGGSTVTLWRSVRSASGLTVQGFAASAWSNFSIGGVTTHTGIVTFAATGGQVRLVIDSTYRAYRGSIRAVPVGASPVSRTVVVTTMDSYLRSVVPSEMPSSWPAAALEAQAVAARTYATFDKESKALSSFYDTCDDTACQVFKGVADYTSNGTLVSSHEAAPSTAAVAATAGRVAVYAGSVAFTQFSSANGGWAAAGSQPYLAAFADPYDGVVPSTAHSWTTTISASTIQSAYPSIGVLRSVSLVRDGHGEWGGRVTSITLVGSSASVTVSGEAFRSATGMKSTWWAPASTGWSAYNLIVAPGDWNGDARPDLLARTADGALWLRAGLTDGTAPPQQIGNGWSAFDAILGTGDWSGDGHPDLLARKADGSLWLYPGNGHGGFLPNRAVGQGWSAFDPILGPGDWSGDGPPDLLARSADGSLWLYPGDGRGGFLPKRQVGQRWQGMTALVGPGDWSGDGHVDVLARRADGTLWLYPGNGSGGFLAARQVGAGWQIFDTILGPGDWSRDGHADLVGRRTDGSLWLYPGNGAGGFLPPRQIGSP